MTFITVVISAIGTRARKAGNKNESGDHPSYNIIKIGKNSENRDLGRLAVNQIPVRNYRLTPMWKTPIGVSIN